MLSRLGPIQTTFRAKSRAWTYFVKIDRVRRGGRRLGAGYDFFNIVRQSLQLRMLYLAQDGFE